MELVTILGLILIFFALVVAWSVWASRDTTIWIAYSRPWFVLLAVITIASGYLVAYLAYHQGEENKLIPYCMEDEVLTPITYPYEDANDLRCTHIDDL